VNLTALISAVCISIVGSYFVVEQFFGNVIMSDFQEIMLYIWFACALLFLLSPIFLAKQNKEDKALLQSLETYRQNSIKRKNMKTFIACMFITSCIASMFLRLVYKDLNLSTLQEWVAHVSIYVGIFALFGYPVIIVRSRALIRKNKNYVNSVN
jgi:hypothetical protein